MKPFLEWKIPVHTVSEANVSEHWTKKKRRHDIQKKWVWLYFKKESPKIILPCTIQLTRVGKKLLDSDNLPVSMKYIRDAIADQIFPGLASGQADNDSRLSWTYDQKTDKDYAVIVTFLQNS